MVFEWEFVGSDVYCVIYNLNGLGGGGGGGGGGGVKD